MCTYPDVCSREEMLFLLENKNRNKSKNKQTKQKQQTTTTKEEGKTSFLGKGNLVHGTIF